MNEYIYSIDDFERAIQEALKDMFGGNLVDFVEKEIIKNLESYVNLYRFYDRNCAGCVSGNTECDFAYGRNEAKDCWEKAKKGELFNCPVRVNGTMVFSPKEGLKKIDLSNRDKLPYPIIIIEENLTTNRTKG